MATPPEKIAVDTPVISVPPTPQAIPARQTNGNNNVAPSQGGVIRWKVTQNSGNWGHDLGLSSPGDRIFAKGVSAGQSGVLGVFEASTPFIFKLVSHGLGAPTVFSTDAQHCIITSMGLNHWQLRWEDGQDKNFQDVVMEVWLDLNPALGPDQTLSPNECPLSSCSEQNSFWGGPINALTGNYNYQMTDISIPTRGLPLEFERTYNSLMNQNSINPLGYGWTHNYDLDLDIKVPTITLKAAHGSLLRFYDNGQGGYTGYPGVWATMSRPITGTYVITTASQIVYRFETIRPRQVFLPCFRPLIYLPPIAQGEDKGEEFGLSLTVDKHGAIVGAPNALNAGTTDIVIKQGGNWTKTVRLTPSDGLSHDKFGYSVATDGANMIVGVPGKGNDTGAVYIFVPTSTLTTSQVSWLQQAKLTASDGNKNDKFGSSVAIYGDYAIVGAPDDKNNGPHSGAAYIFKRIATTDTTTNEEISEWVEQTKLTLSNGVVRDRFGASVAINNDYAIIGMPGEDSQGTDTGGVVVFKRNTTTNQGNNEWLQQGLLQASDGQGHDLFGYSVNLRGDDLIIGAPQADVSGNKSGAAYVFSREATTNGESNEWIEQAKLTPNDGSVNNQFGYSVALGENLALVGSPRDNDSGNDSGSAYLFEREGTTWLETTKFLATDGSTRDLFGSSVALGEPTADYKALVVVGTPGHGNKIGEVHSMALLYDSLKLVAITDAHGNTNTLTYTFVLTNNQFKALLKKVIDPTGQRWLQFGYNRDNHLETVTDHTGRVIHYGYDQDDLTLMTDPLSKTWVYSYTTPHLLKKVIDPTHKVIEETHYQTATNRAIWQANGLGQKIVEIASPITTQRVITNYGAVITETYNERNLLVSQEDALGRKVEYGYDAFFNRSVIKNVYGHETKFLQDPFGLTHIITDALTKTTTFGYDFKTHNLTVVTNAKGIKTSFVYDAQNNLRRTNTVSGPLRYDYNSYGQLISMTNRKEQTTRLGYNPVGDMDRLTNALSQVTRLGYDELGRVTTVTNALDQVTTLQYDARDQLRQTIANYKTDCSSIATDCNLMTSYGYDLAGRLAVMTDTIGRPTKYFYDEAGRTARVIVNYQDGDFDSHQPTQDIITRYEYDAVGRLASTFETTAQGERESRVIYDDLNRVTTTIFNAGGASELKTHTIYEPHQPIVTVIDPTHIPTRYVYDKLGRLSQVIGNYSLMWPADKEHNLTTTYSYDDVGNLASMTDPKGVVTKYDYDDLNRLAGVTADEGGLNIQTRYGLDNEGNIKQVLNLATNRKMDYQYDALNRLQTVQRDGGLGEMGYQYDLIGNMEVMTDGNGIKTAFKYDGLNRLRNIDYFADNNFEVTFGYDRASRRVSMDDGTGKTTYGYDLLDRVTAITASNKTVGYGYDVQGNQTRLTYPDGKAITYTYDSLDRLDTLTDWTGGVYDYDYTTDNRLDQLKRPNDVTTAYDYDAAGRLNDIRHFKQADKCRGGLAFYEYDLDATGNISHTVESQPKLACRIYLPIIMLNATGSSTVQAMKADIVAYTSSQVITYSYDNLYRLTNATYPNDLAFGYDYDEDGNRLSQTTPLTTTTYGYDDANRLTKVNGQVYKWDNNGNLKDDGLRQYTYDAANRLTQVISGGATSQFVYNGDGDRVARIVNGVRTDYVIDPTGLAQVLSDSQGNSYIPGLAEFDGNAWQYQLTDYLGSNRLMTGQNGQILGQQDFDPFGNPLSSQQGMFGYTGEQTDSSGLVYLRARYYNPNTGTFLTKDPFPGVVQNPITLHPYLYTGNNPINRVDPSGEYFDSVIDIISIGADLGFMGNDLYQLYHSNPCNRSELLSSLGWNSAALAADLISLALPMVVGGGLMVRAAAHGDDALRLANHGDEAVRILYHGTDNVLAESVRGGIDLMKGKLKKDFNPMGKGGFYVTADLEQAMKWARRQANLTKGRTPVVVKFAIPERELQRLSSKVFRSASKEWEQFVKAGRRGSLQHAYDFVEGPMLANPTGQISVAIGHQIAIFTDEAAKLFNRFLVQ